MTVISLSTSTTNTVRDNRQASKAFTFRHSSHIYYTKSLLNLFYASIFDINCSGCILKQLKTVVQNPTAPAARGSATGGLPIQEPHIPPPFEKKSTRLGALVVTRMKHPSSMTQSAIKHKFIVQKLSKLQDKCRPRSFSG